MLESIKAGKKLKKIFFNIIALLFLTQVALASYDTKYNDEFNSGTLDTIRWHSIRESPSNWTMTGTSFQMNVTNSEMYQGFATAPLLLQDITDNNISIITKLSAIPTTKYEGGGLIFYSDDDNFVQYEYYTDNVAKKLILKKEENNVSVYKNSISIASYPIYLMLNKNGNSYTAYYSTSEGGSWIEAYNFTLGTVVNQAGLVTAGAGSSSGNAFIYDYFRANRSDTMSSITDPQTTTGNFWINNTWVNPSFVDFNQTMIKFANDTVYMNVSNTTNFMNITYSPHYIQNFSAQTMDTSGNVNSIRIWFNASIPNNIPVQAGISDKTVTAGNWLNFTLSATDADGDSPTYGTDATKGSLDPSTGEFAWLTTGSDVGTYIWEFNSSDIYGGIDTETITVTVNAAPTYLPPSPVSIASSQGNFWINYTWSSGLGNVTDSYNVSVNGVWNNGSATTYNNSTLGAHGWSNISVYAFNSSGTGTLNSVPLTSETQINNNAPVQAGILDKTVTAGNWLNFTLSATDADGDTITYGTNATKGEFNTSTGSFNWSTTSSDVAIYVWEFNSSDVTGEIDTKTITVTVNVATVTTATQSSSSSDGGIGSGVVSAEPYDNIDRSDMTEMYLVLNTPVLFTFKFPEISIYEIAVTGKETNNMALKVEALKGPTKNPGISAFSGTVYKNVNVLASSKSIKEGQIRFKVENIWIANAGNDLRMVKWDGSKWVDLETSEIKKDDTYTFYEANTDSFGSFAIIAMKDEVVPAKVVEKTTADLKPVTPSSTPVPTKTPGFEAIIAIFAIVMLAALLKNNKQRR